MMKADVIRLDYFQGTEPDSDGRFGECAQVDLVVSPVGDEDKIGLSVREEIQNLLQWKNISKHRLFALEHTLPAQCDIEMDAEDPFNIEKYRRKYRMVVTDAILWLESAKVAHKEKIWLQYQESADQVLQEITNAYIASMKMIAKRPSAHRGYMFLQNSYNAFRRNVYRIVAALPQKEQDAVNIHIESKKLFVEETRDRAGGTYSKARFLRHAKGIPYRN